MDPVVDILQVIERRHQQHLGFLHDRIDASFAGISLQSR